ncbi:beta-ketoacyl synthase N-terminal-like domain-containing protein [Streptomyces sp. NPDC051954]|uniref:beta-ketoacyl synthase N-terminal-like domain-containing protein n=1 Tax=Streptomyces sp. NPDC051954 TaxID=3155524 RepID=UPI00341A6001
MKPSQAVQQRRGTDIVVTSAGVLHPAATTVAELDRVLRRGEPALRATSVPGSGGELAIPAAHLDAFDLRSWAQDHCDDPPSRRRLRRVASRATLPVQTACCVALSACTAGRLSSAEARDTSVVIAGNNLALTHQSRTATAYAADPSVIRAGHLLDCFDTDALGAVGEVTGCGGEGWPIGGSSAAGALALIHATRMVATGQSPRCLVVAPVNDLSPVEISAFAKAGAMARIAADGDATAACRPFDESHDGFAAAHIAAAVLIEPASQAYRRGIRPLGRILGSGTGTDGRRGTQPDTDGQIRAMRTALSDAGLAPSDIDYVNAHGTGSAIGDDSEAAALSAVFGAGEGAVTEATAAERAVTEATAPEEAAVEGPWINSTKALLGHGLGAAGLVEAVATLLQLTGGYCHANPRLAKPVRADLRFVTDTITGVPLPAGLSNSFAFSGINACLVLGRTTEEDSP